MFLFPVSPAQSEGNAHVAGAAVDCPLTELGRRQAHAVARQLAARVDLVLASPYARALETAEAIRAAANGPGEIVPLIHEHHLSPFPSEWPLMPRAAIAEGFPHFSLPQDWRDAG